MLETQKFSTELDRTHRVIQTGYVQLPEEIRLTPNGAQDNSSIDIVTTKVITGSVRRGLKTDLLSDVLLDKTSLEDSLVPVSPNTVVRATDDDSGDDSLFSVRRIHDQSASIFSPSNVEAPVAESNSRVSLPEGSNPFLLLFSCVEMPSTLEQAEIAVKAVSSSVEAAMPKIIRQEGTHKAGSNAFDPCPIILAKKPQWDPEGFC